MEDPREENVDLLREHARVIFQAGLEAVDPVKAIKRFVSLQGNTLCVAEHKG